MLTYGQKTVRLLLGVRMGWNDTWYWYCTNVVSSFLGCANPFRRHGFGWRFAGRVGRKL